MERLIFSKSVCFCSCREKIKTPADFYLLTIILLELILKGDRINTTYQEALVN